jgi:hypothetical protein
MGRPFNKAESKLVNELMADIVTYRLTEPEGMKYIKARFRVIGITSYKKRHAFVNSDKNINLWLTHFTRIGFVQHHKKQIEDAIRIQDHSLRDFITEISRAAEDQDHDLIYKIKHDMRENIRLLTDLGLGTPIISALKAKLDKVDNPKSNKENAPGIQGNSKPAQYGR